eukprot:Amastigsp_a8774_6.p4 type:complete len:118 gc:universal Amastigsp_a8774_6:531-884(+)
MARETAIIDVELRDRMYLPRTLAPRSASRRLSPGSEALWSIDISTAIPARETTHRESPTLATMSRSFDTVMTVAVEPSRISRGTASERKSSSQRMNASATPCGSKSGSAYSEIYLCI